MTSLNFSNGLVIDSSQIVSIESTQRIILFPGDMGELDHLLKGRPSSLVIRLRDESRVEINAGNSRLRIHVERPKIHDGNDDALSPNEVVGNRVSDSSTVTPDAFAPLQ